MSRPLHTALVDLLDSPALSDIEIRRLIGWYALSLVDLLQRRCITVRYAEQALFNLDVVQKLAQRHLDDCVELLDWGMQLEDWEEHTPEQLPEALTTIAQFAQRLLAINSTPSSTFTKPAQQHRRQRSRTTQEKVVKRRSPYA